MRSLAVRASLWIGAALGAVALVVVSGIVPAKASSGHSAPIEWLLHFAFRRSVATHSIGIEAPPLDERRLVHLGAGHYEGGCRPCHGAPGTRGPRIPQNMTPAPPELPERVGAYDAAELFYIVRHGVKFTGMPAWPAGTRDDEVWAVVAFLRVLPRLDAHGYERLVYGDEAHRRDPAPAPPVVTRRCARCHGVDGLGRDEGAFPRLAGQRADYLEASLAAYATATRYSGIMEPIAAGLEAAEVREAVRWYAGRPRPAGSGEGDGLGRAIAQSGRPERRIPPCAPCHGPGDGPRRSTYPRLAGQHAAYLEQQLRLFTARARGGTVYAELMRAVTDHALEPDEIRAVARYYAALPGEGSAGAPGAP